MGSSTNNSELGLTFEYNGFGRVEGQAGGPGHVAVRPGAYVPAASQRAVTRRARPPPPTRARRPRERPPRHAGRAAQPPARTHGAHAAHARRRAPRRGREKNPIPFGGPPGPLRLFGVGLGDQGAWMLPFALFGLLGWRCSLLLDRGRQSAAGGLRAGSAAAATRGWRPRWCSAGGSWWRCSC